MVAKIEIDALKIYEQIKNESEMRRKNCKKKNSQSQLKFTGFYKKDVKHLFSMYGQVRSALAMVF